MQDRYFVFDGMKSMDFGVSVVRADNKAEVATIGSASINSQTNKYRIMPHTYSVARENLELSFNIMVFDGCGNIGKWTPQKYREIGKWLIHNEYKSLRSPDDNGKIYYVILTEMSDFELVNQQGFMRVTFTTNSPFAWSLPSIGIYNPLSENPIVLHNASNIYDKYYPDMYIESYKKQDIKIKNYTTGQEFIIKNVAKGENIEIDGYNKIIKTDVFGKNIFKEFNREWLYIKYGNNNVEISGDCRITFESQFPIF